MPTSSKELFDEVFNRIVQLLESGTVPWRKPWKAKWPQNLFTRHHYSGINFFLLTNADFGSPYWATENQIVNHRGSIKADQKDKPHHVIYLIPPSRNVVEKTGQVRLDFQNRPWFLLGAHTVYNSEQTEGVEKLLQKRLGKPRPPPLEEAERIVSSMPQRPEIKFNPQKAYYLPPADFVSVPPRESFGKAEEYYSTLFHELVHATGHASRLARKTLMESDSFRGEIYSQEELVAEMGAAMLCAMTGIAPETLDNSASYIASWLRVLKGDRNLLVTASFQAQKAADFILGRADTASKHQDRITETNRQK